MLDRAGITLNNNTIPDDPRCPFVTSGLRIGTAVGDHPGHDRDRDGAPSPRSSPGPCASRDRRRRARRRPRRRRHPVLQVHAVPLTASRLATWPMARDRAWTRRPVAWGPVVGRRTARSGCVGRALARRLRGGARHRHRGDVRGHPAGAAHRGAGRGGGQARRAAGARATDADAGRRRHARRLPRRDARGLAHARLRRDLRQQHRAARPGDRGGPDARGRAPSTTSARSRRRPRWPASSCAASVLVFSGISLLSSASRSWARSSSIPNWSYLLSVIWVLGHGQRHQPHRRARRAGRRHRGHRGRHVLPLRHPAAATTGVLPDGQHRAAHRRASCSGMCLGLPALQLPPGQDLHGRRRRAAARPADGGVDDGGRRAHRPARSAARRSSSSPRCSSRWSSSACPILDTAWSIVRRAAHAHGRWPPPTRTTCTTASMRLGHGQRRSVLILWAWTALLSGFVLYPTYTDAGDAIVPIGIAGARPRCSTPCCTRGSARPTGPTPRPARRHDWAEAEGAMATVEDPVPSLRRPRRRDRACRPSGRSTVLETCGVQGSALV